VYRTLHHILVVLGCVKYRVVTFVFTDLEYPSVEYNSYDKLSVDSGGKSFSVDTQPPKSVSYGNIPHYSRTASTVSLHLICHIFTTNNARHLSFVNQINILCLTSPDFLSLRMSVELRSQLKNLETESLYPMNDLSFV